MVALAARSAGQVALQQTENVLYGLAELVEVSAVELKLKRRTTNMASDLNNTVLIGRLTRDIEAKTTTSGKEVANFSLAVNGYNDEVSFIDCVAFGKTVEILAKYTQKGKQLGVNGRLQQRSYNAKDGTKRYATEVIVNSVQLLGGKTDEQPRADVAPVDIPDDNTELLKNIPF